MICEFQNTDYIRFTYVCETYVEALFEEKLQLFRKRKTRVFPLFMGLCELFTTTLLILLATATWRLVLEFLSAFSGF